MANRRADILAKRGAALHRVTGTARRELEEAEAAAHWVAKAIGLATWAANNRETEPKRDAEPDQGWRRRRQRQPRARPLPAPRVARPVALGGHRLQRHAAGWTCDVCLTKSIKWHRIARAMFGGTAAGKSAARAKLLAEVCGHSVGGGTDGVGHIRFLSDGTTWCDNCGAYADTFAVGLSRVCPGRPMCSGKEQHLRRLRRGRHPVTNIPSSASLSRSPPRRLRAGREVARQQEGRHGDLSGTSCRRRVLR